MVIPVFPAVSPLPPAVTFEEPWPEVQPGTDWSALDTEAKRERIVSAAGRLFARDGLEAPMPAVAALAGAGVGSLYRQFPSKRELLAALVMRRMEQIRQAALQAAASDGNRWQALTEMLWTTAERHSADGFLGEAWAQVEDHEEVRLATRRVEQAIEALLALAREEGSLRADATFVDVRLLFVSARAVRQIDRDAWRRLVQLMIDGLAATRP
jgi:AcrR family transcriptional regulator